MYHSMNTVLQLEKMPDKSIDLEENRKREIKDYDKLIPVITLIWLAADDLNFKDDFVSYMMTGEIVNDFIKNKKYSKYLKWFELAEKTRNRLNEKGWFDEYLKDEIFVEIIKRINIESFEQVDWEYITDYEEFQEKVKRYEQVFFNDGRDEGIEIGIYRKAIDTANKGIELGLSNEVLKTMTGLTDSEINKQRKLQTRNNL